MRVHRTSFSVALRVSTQEPLRATLMQLRYPHGVLEPLEVRPGRFIGKGAFSYRGLAGRAIAHEPPAAFRAAIH
jgi:hypothetical protein